MKSVVHDCFSHGARLSAVAGNYKEAFPGNAWTCREGPTTNSIRSPGLKDLGLRPTVAGHPQLAGTLRLPYFLGASRATILERALILRRQREMCSRSKTQTTLPSASILFT